MYIFFNIFCFIQVLPFWPQGNPFCEDTCLHMREGVFSDSDQEARGNLKKNSSSLLSMTKTFIFIDMTSEIGFYKFYSQLYGTIMWMK